MVGPLLAQAARGAAAGPNDVFAGVGLGVLVAVVLVMAAVGLTVAIFYLLTLSKALRLCRPDNRTMEPGMVWLNFIPLFNLVWQFVTVLRVSESLGNEFADRGRDRGGDYGKSVGLAYCTLGLLGIIPLIGPLFSIAGLVCFIMYWVKVAGFNAELARRPAGDEDDDYEDDRPRGSKNRRREEDYEDDYEDDRPQPRKPWEK